MPGMKAMTYMMPVMFMFMLNNFSSGLKYYYFLTNLNRDSTDTGFKTVCPARRKILRKIEEKQTKTFK